MARVLNIIRSSRALNLHSSSSLVRRFSGDDIDYNKFVARTSEIDNPEFKKVIVDAENRLLWGKHHDGTTTNINLPDVKVDGVSLRKIVAGLAK